MSKLAYLVLPAFLLQILATTQFETDQIGTKKVLLTLSYAILALGVLGLRGRVVRALAVCGVLLNAAPIFANGGLMPATPEAVEQATGDRPALYTTRIGSKDIVLPRDETRLYPLTDRIVIERIHNVVSIGDLVLASALVAYVGLALASLVVPRRPRASESTGPGSSL